MCPGGQLASPILARMPEAEGKRMGPSVEGFRGGRSWSRGEDLMGRGHSGWVAELSDGVQYSIWLLLWKPFPVTVFRDVGKRPRILARFLAGSVHVFSKP